LANQAKGVFEPPPLKILLDSPRLLGALDARGVGLDLAGLTGELVHEPRSGFEGSGEVTFGFLTVEMEFGWLGSDRIFRKR
jgi:hypothetical protein